MSSTEYVLALQGARAERGLVAFNALPVLLAVATLDKVETHGAGSKISRPAVYRIVRRMNRALDRDLPVISLGESLAPETRLTSGGAAS